MFIASSIGGILPDILDPAYTTRHRGLAHSKIVLLIFVLFTVISLFTLLDQHRLESLVLYYFFFGYISHLSLDSTTPSGLR